MLIFFQELGLQLFLWLLQLVDGLMELFSAIAGVTTVNYHGQQVNIVEFIIGDTTIGAVFWCIFITAVGLTCIFTIVGLVKNMIANNRNVSTIVGKFFWRFWVQWRCLPSSFSGSSLQIHFYSCWRGYSK